ncbi:MarR family winged helix-turn-helix transcriptional regulator [Sneathiella limimaris]|uniref:MarR family winged helix-turn-helix transcriptional regulator n=1 Tax=Sneathiella limimaris TaxID=1964213 RepID=UPI00146A6820|nr:MarR family transcriptional regulator [Sneathiella limimaris]
MTKNHKPDIPIEFRIINWIGIIDQLTGTKARQLLNGTDVPPPQFALLNHFSHRPEEGKTVMQVATAMQQPQPGITKTISKLVRKGFLEEHKNPRDGRSKILLLTAAGIKAHQIAREKLISGSGDVFKGWSENEKNTLFQLLDRLKIHLDNNR